MSALGLGCSATLLNGFPTLPSGLVLRALIDMDKISGTDGSPLASFSDSLGNVFSNVDGTGAIYWANQYPGGGACLEFNANMYRSTDAALVNVVNGQANPIFSVFTAAQQTFKHNTTNYFWGWGRQAASPFSAGIYCRSRKATWVQEYLDNVAAADVTGAGLRQLVLPNSQLVETYRNGAAVAFGVDGYEQAPQAIPNVARALDSFVIGGEDSTAPTLASQGYLQKLIVIAGDVSAFPTFQSELYTWFRYNVGGLGFKKNLGALLASGATKTRGFIAWGQSNEPATAGTNNMTPFEPTTTARVSMLALSGAYRGISNPVADATNQVTGAIVHEPAGPGVGIAVGGSSWQRFFNRITAVDAVNPCIFAPTAKGSSGSDSWATGATSSPPQIDTLAGLAQLRLLEMSKAPSFVMSLGAWNQGQLNATTVVAGKSQPAYANSYAADWQTFLSGWESLMTALGILWEKPTLHYLQMVLSAMDSGLYQYQPNVVTQQGNLQAANPTVMVNIVQQYPATDPAHLHEDQPELDIDGDNRADAYLSH